MYYLNTYRVLLYICTLIPKLEKVILKMDSLGTKIRLLRKKNGYSLRQFGQMCNLSHSYISDIENGRTNPSLQTLQIIAENLNTSMSYLLGESSNQCFDKKQEDQNEKYYTIQDYEILTILNKYPKLKQYIYELKKAPTRKINVFLETWNFIQSIYDNIEK
ncbi:Transcriptional regulator, contains XRE-family HTH domain [Tepidimicrobium xylanilyticum]|uniref:Transcriptional regulator, contains XRE-family HTH domain n=2 Tax=Tepidimicrobium xylanilyticum TaxID=1123352 RepID=A0A1H3AS40_9FIRM|nr:Transcriptional regulator, contains XRE-family HTH domain [Tepidimicrobium xylanilyticum]